MDMYLDMPLDGGVQCSRTEWMRKLPAIRSWYYNWGCGAQVPLAGYFARLHSNCMGLGEIYICRAGRNFEIAVAAMVRSVSTCIS